MMANIVRGALCFAALVVIGGPPLGAQEPTWLGGHTQAVRCVAVLPDGRAVSGGDDAVVKVWNIASEELLITLEGHESAVTAVAATADGRVVSATDAEVRVWNPDAGDCLRAIPGDCAPIAVTRNGVLIAHVRGNAHTLHVRDLNADTAPRDLEWDTASGAGPIAVMRDGRLVSAHQGGEIRVWDAKIENCERALRWDDAGRITALVTSPDWRLPVEEASNVRAALGDEEGRISVWDLEAGALQNAWQTETGRVHALAFLADGRLVSAGTNAALDVWDAATGRRLGTGTGHDGEVVGLAVLPGGRVLSASEDCSIGLWAFGR